MEIVRVFKNIKNHVLIKDYKKKRIINKIKNNQIIKSEFGKYILEFVNRIQENNSTYDFGLLCQNLKKLKIVIVPELREGIMGVYDVAENTIFIDENYLDRIDQIIYHELFHMSSAKVEQNEHRTGFLQEGLFEYFNEGYTEVLTKRYFSDKSPECPYLFEMIIAEMLEKIIGQNLMEELYSKADNLSMLLEFSKYTPKQETTYLTLQRVNVMSKYYESQDYPNCMKECKEIIIVLMKSFIKKCEIDLIDQREIDSFFQTIPLFYTYEDEHFDIFTQEEVNEYKKQCYANHQKSLKKNFNSNKR